MEQEPIQSGSNTAGRVLRTSRIDLDQCFLRVARLIGERSTCARRAVGCVLVDDDYHVLATGHNGVAKSVPHCIDHPCPGANCPSGQGLHLCEAIHAEQNALLQCHDIGTIHTCYVTASPCIQCVRLLLNTHCGRIIFAEEYPHPEAERVWKMAGRIWFKLGI